MTISELAERLKNMYDNAKEKETVVSIHLFGIKYGHEILSNKYNTKEIVRRAGINASYSTEINKAVNLSKYVELKNNGKRN